MNKILVLLFIIFCNLNLASYAVTFSGENVPFDSSAHVGLVNGPGTGVAIGADVFYPLEFVSLGGEIEQQVTNSEFEQNINILKYGLAAKYIISDDLYITLHYGSASFYLGKGTEYSDSLTGSRHYIEDDTRGTAGYWGFAPNFRVGEYFITPKVIFNNINGGGTILEVDLNIGHRF